MEYLPKSKNSFVFFLVFYKRVVIKTEGLFHESGDMFMEIVEGRLLKTEGF